MNVSVHELSRRLQRCGYVPWSEKRRGLSSLFLTQDVKFSEAKADVSSFGYEQTVRQWCNETFRGQNCLSYSLHHPIFTLLLYILLVSMWLLKAKSMMPLKVIVCNIKN